MLALLLAVLLNLGLPGMSGEDLTLTVTGRDNLYTVARSHSLALEHLAFANRLPVSLAPLKDGQLVVPRRRILPANPPSDGLVLNLPERGVYLYRHGSFIKFYPVAIGMPGWNTPVGTFTIATREVDPTWDPPAWAGVAGPVGPGPDNPLGDRWLGLSRRGYGMHGTNRPDSIGGAVSHGCIRMYPESIRDLFGRVEVGLRVRIEYEPVKLGCDPASGRIFLAVFPDVYGRTHLLSRAQELLSRAGLSSLTDPLRLRAIVAAASGRAEPLIGEEIEVVIDQAPPLTTLGLLVSGRLYLSASFLEEQLGLSTEEEVLSFSGQRWLPVASVLRKGVRAYRFEERSLTIESFGEDGEP
ncbi:MAG: hypothetical protein AMXMBFR33_25170 [Candidatus Xenobia bacterium]